MLAPSTDVRCPICGTSNPEGAKTCLSCGTRLTTTSTPHSDKNSPADNPEDIVPFTPPELAQGSEDASGQTAARSSRSSEWLRGEDRGQKSSQETNGARSDVPEWLREIRAEAENETPAPSKPQISEIKLTRDDYDYSDIGGQVTDEMKTALEAQASQTQSVEDQVALARRLLGLDVETPPAAVSPTKAPLAEPTPETISRGETSEVISQASGAPSAVSETAAETESQVPTISEPNAQIEAASAKPQISEIKLTREDYDYSDIGGQVTDEMKAALEAQASQTQSVEDQVALARRLLGLEMEAPITQAPVSESLAAQPTAGIPPAETSRGEILEPPSPQEPDKAVLESGQVPDWLQELAPREATQTPAVPQALGAEEGAMPEWLRELASAQNAPADPETKQATPGAQLPVVPDLEEHERDALPEWLREPLLPAERVAPAPSEAITTEESFEAASEETPNEPEIETPERQPPTPFELPDWLTSAESVTPGTHEPFEIVETTGPLAGIRGILPLAAALTEPQTLTTAIPTRSDGGRVFQTLLAEPLTPVSPAQPVEGSRARFGTNHVLYLVILLAALIPLFLSLNEAGIGLDATNSSAPFYDQLSSVPANSIVLLAFDYTPGEAVELDPAARAIVNEIVTRKANVIAISSNPFGATMAQTLLSRANESDSNFQFVNLGYLFGNEAGLKRFALGWIPANQMDAAGVRWDASPLSRRVRGMDDLALVILLEGSDSSLRAWMEQVRPNVKTPIVSATTAMIDPQARNYVNARQLQASLRGLAGAAELELLSNQTGRAVKTVDALSFVSLVLAGIVIVANVMWLIKRK